MGLLDLIKGIVGGGAPAEDLAENEAGTPALFERSLTALANSETQQFINIGGADDVIVQVAKGGAVLHLNIASYPSSDSPEGKLADLGIVLPGGSTLDQWEADVFAQYSVPSSPTQELAAVIDAIFQKLHGCADGYTVSVTLES